MKTSITLGLTLAATLAAVLVPSSNVLAAPAIHNASICQHWNPGEANFPIYYADGIKNSSTSAKTVVCPLAVTHTSGQSTGYVYVDHNNTVGFYCTLYSYSYSDTYLGSKTVWMPPTTKYTYIGTVPANTYSNHSVVCTLPASYGGKVVAIESNF